MARTCGLKTNFKIAADSSVISHACGAGWVKGKRSNGSHCSIRPPHCGRSDRPLDVLLAAPGREGLSVPCHCGFTQLQKSLGRPMTACERSRHPTELPAACQGHAWPGVRWSVPTTNSTGMTGPSVLHSLAKSKLSGFHTSEPQPRQTIVILWTPSPLCQHSRTRSAWP
jgi:hypothetical protein